MKKVSKNKNSNRLNNFKNAQLRIRRKKNQLTKVPMYNNQPQRLGAGTTTRYIEIDYTTTSSQGVINLENDLVTDVELVSYMNRYEFAKLERVNIKIPPNSGNGEMRFLARWSDSTITSGELDNSDSVKRVAIHTVKYQTITYLPPSTTNTRFIDLGTTKEISTVKMDEFNQTDQIYYKSSSTAYSINLPLHIAVRSTTASIELKIILKFIFRGEKYDEKLSKMIYLYHKNDEFKAIVDRECKNLELKNIDKKVDNPKNEEDPWEADPEEDELQPGELDEIKKKIEKIEKKTKTGQ
jgi:hypothetical protein